MDQVSEMDQDLQYNESELLAKVSSGDQKAFTVLVDQYWNKVYSHALAYSKSVSRAQEITQDVFLKVWHKRKGLTEVMDFKSYHCNNQSIKTNHVWWICQDVCCLY